MRPKLLTIFICIFFFNNYSIAEDVLSVTVVSNGVNKEIDSVKKNHLYMNVVGYLSTCIHLESVIGEKYDLAKSRKAFERIRENNQNYIEIYSDSGFLVLPIKLQNQEIDKVYVELTDNQFPNIITIRNEQPQFYAKCMGWLALKMFTCDEIVTELFDLERRLNACKNVKSTE